MVQTQLTDNPPPKKEKIAAETLAQNQREISVSEFFLKNRHLLGFDNPRKALLTAVKEAVDNSLDAAEEMKVLPEIKVDIIPVKGEESRIIVRVEDNGPGIVKEQIPRIFAKLLYGSKFHKMKQSRGQQGIGVSATVMYGQLTTGKPAQITSKIAPKKPAHYFELTINTKNNEPVIHKQEVVEWEKDHGTKIELELEAKYLKGKQSVDDYLKETAIANPHAHIIYTNPEGQKMEFPRATEQLPKEPKEIKPHPYGVELGMLMKMMGETKARTLLSFLQTEFCRVSSKVAKEIILKANLVEDVKPIKLGRQEADNLMKAIKQTKIFAPPTDCLSPIGEETLIKGLKKEVDAEFYAAVTRPPAVYRGNPFQLEVALAFGGSLPLDDFVRLLRFANRVPLLYEQGSCAITKAILGTAWRNYGISQSRGSLPIAPLMIMVHLSSVWVPFTSESKEAIASYQEIIKEVKLALQECGRQLASHIRKIKKRDYETKRKKVFELYMDELVESLSSLTHFDKKKLKDDLLIIAQKRTIGGEDASE
ncbi:DNA topoisomerase VI subunit B [Candidatus Woesearchaeota archaeon]|nr:DNA topoisomerase VI subunit B [Candidatus Woesearchaeota archaeon]